MTRDFEIVGGVFLVQPPYELDLHNNFDFLNLEYSVQNRLLVLEWSRSNGSWVAEDTPKSLKLRFVGVTEFRFLPRTPGFPFSEDDCISVIGHWSDEEGADGVFVLSPGQQPEPNWLMGLEFMSGARLVVQAELANAEISR